MTTDTRELIVNSNMEVENSLNYLLHRAQDIQNLCEDYRIDSATDSNFRFDPDSGNILYKPDNLRIPQVRNSSISRHAFGQLCSKLGVHLSYLDKCIDAGMLDLVADNINAWVQRYERSLFIREYDNRIRGVLSNRYSVLDTPDIIEVLADVIDKEEYITKGHYLTPERFHARIVQQEMLNVDGEDLFAGIQIDSSDVGRSILTVRFMIYKQICTNGLCISKGGGVLFEQRHLGIGKDDFRNSFKQAMSKIPVLCQNAEELINQSVKTQDDYRVDTFNVDKMNDFIESVRAKTKLPEEGVKKVISLMTDRYSPNKWGFINSITEVAQDYTLEKRVELEKVAGDYLLQVA